MYARVLRKWSLHTKLQMPLNMWPLVIKVLLLLVCLASPRAGAVALALTPADGAAATAFSPTTLTLPITPQLPYAVQKALLPALVSSPAPPQVLTRTDDAGATIEESYYIPVAGSADSGAESSLSGRIGSSGNDSPSSSSSIHKIFSRNKFSNNSNQQKTWQPNNVDNLAYSYYRQKAASAPQSPPLESSQQRFVTSAIAANTPATPPQIFSQNHEFLIGDDDDEDDEDGEGDEDGFADVDTEIDAEVDNANDDDLEDDVDEIDDRLEIVDALDSGHQEQEPKVAISSPFMKLLGTFNQPQVQKQQLSSQQWLLTSGSMRSSKIRRHVREHQLQHDMPPVQQQSTALLQQQQQQLTAPVKTFTDQSNFPQPKLVWFVNSKNETRVVRLLPSTHYRIEAYEIPSSLPYRGELTAQQQRMLVHQQHLVQQQQQVQTQDQEQAARSRRDSRVFGLMQTLVGDSNNGYEQFYGANVPQQHQKQQPQQQQSMQQFQSQFSRSFNANNDKLFPRPQAQQQQQQKPFYHNQQTQTPSQIQALPQYQPQTQAFLQRSLPDQQQMQYHKSQQQQQQSHQRQHNKQHQHQHQHHHQHQYLQQRVRQRERDRERDRQRRRPHRYCSARDPAQLAFEAPIVFEGKITSMTSDRRHNFSASVEVVDTYKQQLGYHLKRNQYVRLKFALINGSGECDIYREQLRPRGLVHGNVLEQQRTYIFFVRQVDVSNFTILGQPKRNTTHVKNAIIKAVKEDYAQLASIRTITTNRTMEIGRELHIVCKVQGRPPPKVTWFKDGKSINRNRKLYKFNHYRKRSELIIRSFNISDTGRYECRAKNKVNQNQPDRRTIMIKADPVPRYATSLTGGTGNVCPDDASEFCLNGGTCNFFSEIGSYSCICPEGFMGERCDRKEVNNISPSTYSNEQECGEKKFYGSYYC